MLGLCGSHSGNSFFFLFVNVSTNPQGPTLPSTNGGRVMRKHGGIVFCRRLAAVLLAGLLIVIGHALLAPGQVFADGGDDFNDGMVDPALWGGDEVKGQGRLDEVNGRLEYSTSASGTSIDSSDRSLRRRFPYNAPWAIQIDATNTTTSGTFNSFGINVEGSRDVGDSIEVELAAFSGAWSEFYENGQSIAFASGAAPGTTATIQMSFNNTSKVISVAYWTGADWFVFGTFGVGALGGGLNGNANWGLIDTDYFEAYVFGYSEGIQVSSGELYGDNFGETGGIPLPPAELVANEGTTGTEITITGSGFGTKKGKVLLGPDGKTKLKIAKDGWRDDRIIGTVSKVPLAAGSYPVPFGVTVITKSKPPETFVATDTFTVTNPVIDEITPLSGDIGEEIEISGMFFGTKKGKVYLEDQVNNKMQGCKITYWLMDKGTGASTVRFLVPKLANGAYPLYVSNKKVGMSQPGITFGVGLAPSDSNLKENITPVDGKDVLTRLAGIPVSVWNYKSQDPSIRHIGPMAQDFQAAFRVGESDRFISMVDSGGVALASIQGLYSILQEKDREIRDLRRENTELKEEIRDIGKRLGVIEHQIPK